MKNYPIILHLPQRPFATPPFLRAIYC